jgi:hypothetical protein
MISPSGPLMPVLHRWGSPPVMDMVPETGTSRSFFTCFNVFMNVLFFD